jgi:hypothetical protein
VVSEYTNHGNKEQHKIIERVENQLINQKEEIIALRKIIEKLQEK